MTILRRIDWLIAFILGFSLPELRYQLLIRRRHSDTSDTDVFFSVVLVFLIS